MGSVALSKRAAELKPSPTLAIAAKAKAMRAAGQDVISLSVGEPDFDTPAHIKKAAEEAIAAGFTKYTPAEGIPELRAAVCASLKADQGLEYKPGNVVVGCGAKHVIANALFALVDEGDEVLVPAPYWVSYPAMAQLAGGTARIVYPDGSALAWNPDESPVPAVGAGFKLSPAALAKGLTKNTKVVILNAPSNPSGEVYSGAELKGLAEVLEKSGAYIISDEIYDALVYDGSVRSIVAVCPALRERVIIVNGVSKTYAMTGWRIGWAVGPEAVISAVGNIQSQTTSNPASISQKAALAALTGPQDCVATMRAEFAARRDMMVEGLSRMTGVKCAKPGGAFYVFPDMRDLLGNPKVAAKLKLGSGLKGASTALCNHLLESARVATVPGAEFGMECHLRLSYATSREAIGKALERIGQAVAELGKG